MRRLNKKGIELTISFIVMIILAMATMSGSFILIKKFFGEADQLKASIDSQTQSQIRGMLLGGAKVAIPVNREEAHRGDFVTFPVGILNVLKQGGTSNDFTIIANTCTGSIDITPHGAGSNDYSEQTVPVKKNEQQTVLVGYQIEKNVPTGTYICNIEVLDEYDEPYGESRYKAYITIK